MIGGYRTDEFLALVLAYCAWQQRAIAGRLVHLFGAAAVLYGLWGSVLGLVLLLFGGALAFTLLTRRLRRLNDAVRTFRRSDFDRQAIALTPVPRQRDEIDELTNRFLEVAQHVSDQYRALREADAYGPSLIMVVAPTDEGPLLPAVLDRLAKASAPRP